MEGKTIKFDNPEEAEKYSAIFSIRGNIKVSPTEIYEKMKVPDYMRATFIIKPYNPITAEKVKKINRDACSKFEDNLIGQGLDKSEFANEIKKLEATIDNFEKPIPEGLAEEFETLCESYFEKNKVWVEAWKYGQRSRDLAAVYEIVEEHTISVENLPIKDGDELVRWSGDVDMEVLFGIPAAIVNWLDEELQVQSGLSESEIRGL